MVLKWDNNADGNNYGFKLKPHDENQDIFHAIYLVDNYTGALFVSNKYSSISNFSNTNEDLISGFLNAMNLFINEINVNEEIQEINFKQMRILYERKDRLMVIAISKKQDLQIEKYIVHEILTDFYFRFKKQITQFNGIIDPAIINYKKRLQTININALNSRRNTIWSDR